jgi:hypothetical protein
VNPSPTISLLFPGRLYSPRKYLLPAEDPESEMTSSGKHGDQVFGNPPFGQKHFEDLVPGKIAFSFFTEFHHPF